MFHNSTSCSPGVPAQDQWRDGYSKNSHNSSFCFSYNRHLTIHYLSGSPVQYCGEQRAYPSIDRLPCAKTPTWNRTSLWSTLTETEVVSCPLSHSSCDDVTGSFPSMFYWMSRLSWNMKWSAIICSRLYTVLPDYFRVFDSKHVQNFYPPW